MKEKIRLFAKKMVGAIVLPITTLFYCTIPTFCSNAFDVATGVANNAQAQIQKFAEGVFPLAIIITGVAMLFTRDERKFASEKKILIGCIVAFIIIELACRGNITQTVLDWFGTT